MKTRELVALGLLCGACVLACSSEPSPASSSEQSGSAGTSNNGGGSAGASSGGGGAGGAATSGAAGAVSGAGTAGTASAGGNGGSGGNSVDLGGSGGAAGDGGAANEGSTTPDCNSITSEAIITVAKGGSADFETVQAAVDSLPSGNATPTQIRIAPGTYKEKLRIDVPNVTLCGQAGQAASTILTYSDNANTSNGMGGTLGTTGSASTNISSSNVSAENITFANSTVLGGSQAVALLVTSDQVQFRNCRFLSFQDTLYVRKARQYFKSCYVEGSVDYIFGDATAVFEDCTVHSAAGGVAVTAPNTPETVAYGLVFLGGELTAADSVSDDSQTLGRNWGAYGAAAYIGTTLGAHIKPVGWMAMGSNTLATARFSEYQTSGDGASASDIAARAPESEQLTGDAAAAYTIANILGGWTPSFSQ